MVRREIESERAVEGKRMVTEKDGGQAAARWQQKKVSEEKETSQEPIQFNFQKLEAVRREMEVGLDPEEEELEKLQADVKEMADRILHYRQTLPYQLKEGFALLLSDQIPNDEKTEDELTRFQRGLSSDDNQVPRRNPEPDAGAAISEGDEQQMTMKIQLLKRKATVNVAAVPTLLKRIKECISKIESLDSDCTTIHSASGEEDQTN